MCLNLEACQCQDLCYCKEHLDSVGLCMQAAMRDTHMEVQPVEEVLTPPEEEEEEEEEVNARVATPAPLTPPPRRGRPAASKTPSAAKASLACLPQSMSTHLFFIDFM